jgi:hypothetical protein
VRSHLAQTIGVSKSLVTRPFLALSTGSGIMTEYGRWSCTTCVGSDNKPWRNPGIFERCKICNKGPGPGARRKFAKDAAPVTPAKPAAKGSGKGGGKSKGKGRGKGGTATHQKLEDEVTRLKQELKTLKAPDDAAAASPDDEFDEAAKVEELKQLEKSLKQYEGDEALTTLFQRKIDEGRKALQMARDKGLTPADLALNLSKSDQRDLNLLIKSAMSFQRALKTYDDGTAKLEEEKSKIEEKLASQATARAKVEEDYKNVQSKLERLRAKPPVEVMMDLQSLVTGSRHLSSAADASLSTEHATEWKGICGILEEFFKKSGTFAADRLAEYTSVDQEMSNENYEDEDLAAGTAIASKAAADASEGANLEQVKLQAYYTGLRNHKRARVEAQMAKMRSGG